LVVLENVVGLLDKKNRPTRVKIATALKDDCIVNWKVLRSSDFGLPQARRRWYLVARLKRAASGRESKLPTKSGKQCPPLSKFLRAVSGHASSPLLSKTARRNYRAALAKHSLTPETAQKVDLVIDLAASRSRQSSMLGKVPTITASRASTRSYFLTSAQRWALSDSSL
jgi:site-specific DNA-cytosine methylase